MRVDTRIGSCVALAVRHHTVQPFQTLTIPIATEKDCQTEPSFAATLYGTRTCMGEWTEKAGADWIFRAGSGSCKIQAINGRPLAVEVVK
jgi:hypothetical protein